MKYLHQLWSPAANKCLSVNGWRTYSSKTRLKEKENNNSTRWNIKSLHKPQKNPIEIQIIWTRNNNNEKEHKSDLPSWIESLQRVDSFEATANSAGI